MRFNKINFDFPKSVYDNVISTMVNRVPPNTWDSLPEMSIQRLYWKDETVSDPAKVHIDPQTIETINFHLNTRGLPSMYNLVAYIRTTNHGKYNSCHVDLGHDDCLFKTSLVFPMFQTNKMFVYWTTGEYEVLKEQHADSRVEFARLFFHTKRKFVQDQELTVPIAVQIDKPHGVYTDNPMPGGIFTIRLSENLSVSEISKILS